MTAPDSPPRAAVYAAWAVLCAAALLCLAVLGWGLRAAVGWAAGR